MHPGSEKQCCKQILQDVKNKIPNSVAKRPKEVYRKSTLGGLEYPYNTSRRECELSAIRRQNLSVILILLPEVRIFHLLVPLGPPRVPVLPVGGLETGGLPLLSLITTSVSQYSED